LTWIFRKIGRFVAGDVFRSAQDRIDVCSKRVDHKEEDQTENPRVEFFARRLQEYRSQYTARSRVVSTFEHTEQDWHACQRLTKQHALCTNFTRLSCLKRKCKIKTSNRKIN
jgi:uncharacterized membrane protein YgaE (UPF0421/DUF939 family)